MQLFYSDFFNCQGCELLNIFRWEFKQTLECPHESEWGQEKSVGKVTVYVSHVVTHPDTNHSQRFLTLVIRWELGTVTMNSLTCGGPSNFFPYYTDVTHRSLGTNFNLVSRYLSTYSKYLVSCEEPLTPNHQFTKCFSR